MIQVASLAFPFPHFSLSRQPLLSIPEFFSLFPGELV